jgi:hypothetical protein
MSRPSPLLVTCAVCIKLHEPKNPALTNSLCVSCTKPKSKHPARPQ